MDQQQITPPPSKDQGAGIDSVDQGETNYLWNVHRTLYIAVLFGSCLAAAALATVLYLFDPHFLNLDQNDLSLLLVLMVLAVPPVIMNINARMKAHREFIAHMADVLGLSYSPDAPYASVSGTFFSLGYGQRLFNVLSGMYKENPVRIFDYVYMTGYGKSQETHPYTVFELRYDAPLPHVLMNIPELIAPSDVERVKLEGDFNEKFKLYVSTGRQMEIRELFQPDVMQEFIDTFSSYVMEVSGDRVYLMRPGSLPSNRDEFVELISMIDHVIDNILPGLRAAAQS